MINKDNLSWLIQSYLSNTRDEIVTRGKELWNTDLSEANIVSIKTDHQNIYVSLIIYSEFAQTEDAELIIKPIDLLNYLATTHTAATQ